MSSAAEHQPRLATPRLAHPNHRVRGIVDNPVTVHNKKLEQSFAESSPAPKVAPPPPKPQAPMQRSAARPRSAGPPAGSRPAPWVPAGTRDGGGYGHEQPPQRSTGNPYAPPRRDGDRRRWRPGGHQRAQTARAVTTNLHDHDAMHDSHPHTEGEATICAELKAIGAAGHLRALLEAGFGSWTEVRPPPPPPARPSSSLCVYRPPYLAVLAACPQHSLRPPWSTHQPCHCPRTDGRGRPYRRRAEGARLAQDGGQHTHTHQLLPSLPPSDAAPLFLMPRNVPAQSVS